MIDDIIIKVENLSKSFKLYNSPKHRLLEVIHPLRKKYHHDYQALKNISFEIKRGESIGILGKNGAGKSTLLKLITGVLTPSSGNIEIKGRIAALLELGAGFNPTLTGRDNVYFQGAIMGFTREEMIKKVPEIIEFADIGEFIDQPVRTYSSGMFARLAFSIAINVDPDILIVDEALSVGDAAFQAKCMIRMRKLRDSGLTLLFVSHDPGAVKAICDKCLVLENSALKDFGTSVEVVDRYIGGIHTSINKELQSEEVWNEQRLNQVQSFESAEITHIKVSTSLENLWGNSVNRYGSREGKILDIKLINTSGIEVEDLQVDQDFIIQVSVKFEKSFPQFCLGYSIRDLKGQQLVGSLSYSRVDSPSVKSGDLYVIEIRSTNKLKAGQYVLSIGLEVPVILGHQHLFLDVVENAVSFKSHFSPDPKKWFASFVNVPASFNLVKIN